MHFSALIATMASAIATIHAAGCYGETGPGWGSGHQSANNHAEEMCTGTLNGYYDGNSKYACRNLGESTKVEFYITGAGDLNTQDCTFGLQEEINGCGWGGENQHGAFYYRSDPNDGQC